MASLFNKLFCVALGLGLFGPALLAQGQAVPVKTLRWTGRPLKTYGPVETIISETPPHPDDNDNCDNDPVTIEATLLLDFEGYPELVTQREIWVLQDQFVKTFSRLTAQTCDSPGASFTIDEIVISPNGLLADVGAHRFLTGGNTSSGVPVVSYPASIRATCKGKGCPNDNMLFRTNNNSNNNYYNNRALQGAAGDDKASSSTTNTGLGPTEVTKQRRLAGNCPECTAPTENQFVQAYNNDILEGQLIINLERFVGFIQLDEVACSDEIEEFDADLDIDWISEPSITAEEMTFLEEQVVDVYNGLSLMLCNPDFVNLEEAQLIESTPIGDVRRLNLRNNHGERKLAPRRFRNRFRARGRCRGKGCRAKAKRLFDEGVRRLMAMLSSPSGVDHHRVLQETNLLGCFCDPAAAADPALQRAPTAEEFTAAYAAVVAEANLPNVFEVLETTVPPPQPTIAPSPPVPPAPTPPPSRRPTPAPTPAPDDITVERPPVTGNVSSSCVNGTQIFTVDIEVKGAGGLGSMSERTIPFEAVFALDSSGSMSTSDPFGIRKSASIEFLDNLNSTKDFGAVVSWDDDIDFSESLTNDFDFLKMRILEVDEAGGTNLDVGLGESISILGQSSLGRAAKSIIFLTDGGGPYTNCASGGPASTAASRGYRIYSVGLGTGVVNDPLEDMANCTGAFYTFAENATALMGIFDDLFEAVLNSTVPLNVTVTLTLLPGVQPVPGSIDPPPDKMTTDSIGRTTLMWINVDAGEGLPAGESFDIRFDVTATSSGSLTDQTTSAVTFSTPEGATGREPTPDLIVVVEEGICEAHGSPTSSPSTEPSVSVSPSKAPSEMPSMSTSMPTRPTPDPTPGPTPEPSLAQTTLQVDKAGPEAVFANQIIDFTITVKNIGSQTAIGVVLEDQLPDVGSFESSVPPATPIGGILELSVGILEPGESAAVTVRWRAPSTEGTVVNRVTAKADNAADVTDEAQVQVGLVSIVTGGVTSSGTGLRNRQSGTFDITGVPVGATVTRAVLVWAILYRSVDVVPSDQITFEGTVVTADLTSSISESLCWSDDVTVGYAADVTNLVSGNGAYVVTDVINGLYREDANATGVLPYTDGASLFVFYGGLGITDQVISDFTYSAVTFSSGNVNNRLLTGINSIGGKATLTLAGPDGQNNAGEMVTVEAVGSGTLSFNNSWDGSAPQNGPDFPIGNLWDNDIHDVSSILPAGQTTLEITLTPAFDCIGLSGVVLQVEQ